MIGPACDMSAVVFARPMKLARERRSADWLGGPLPSSPAEAVLQDYWRTRFNTEGFPVRLPFWMGTVLQRAHRATDGRVKPADVAWNALTLTETGFVGLV
jgi:hypothetical protein